MKRISKYKGKKLPRYSDGGTNQVDPENPGMTGMMKSKIATEAHYGNPSALRMVSPNPSIYTWTGEEKDWDGNQAAPAGNTGTHYMGSFGNQARPGLQEVDGKMQYFQNPPSNSKENFNFSRPEDAEYFAKHYKEVAPMMRNYPRYPDGGEITSEADYNRRLLLPNKSKEEIAAQNAWVIKRNKKINTEVDIRQTPTSGIVVDKRTNIAYAIGDDGTKTSFNVLTGKNPDLNWNKFSMDELDNNPNKRNTPVGYYKLERQSSYIKKGSDNDKYYNNKYRTLTPIAAYGQGAPQAQTKDFELGFHRAYSDNAKNPNNPEYLRRSALLEQTDPTKRNASYGCVNCEDDAYDEMNKMFPKGDTLMVVDSKNPKDKELLRKFNNKKFAIGGEVDTDPDGSETKANPLLIQAFQQSLANQKINEQKAIDAKNQEIKNNPLGIKTLTTQRDKTNVVPIRQQTTLSKIQADKKRNEADKLLKQQKKTQGTLRETPKEINPNEAWRLAASNYQGHDKEEMNRIINSSKTVEGLGALTGVTGGGLHALASIPAVANTLGLGFAAHGVHSLPSTYRTLVDPNESVYNKARALTYNTADFLGMKQAAEALKVVGTAGKWAYNSAARSVASSPSVVSSIDNVSKEVLERRAFLQNLKDRKLIHPDADIAHFAQSEDLVSNLTKDVVNQKNTYYRGVKSDLPTDPKALEAMKQAGVDLTNKESIGKYYATHIKHGELDYGSGFSTLNRNHSALYTDSGYSGYGDMTFEMKKATDFSKGNYKDWIDDLYKYEDYDPNVFKNIDDVPEWTRTFKNSPGKIAPSNFVGKKGQRIFDNAELVKLDDAGKGFGRTKSYELPGSPNSPSFLERSNLEREGVKTKSNVIKENIQEGSFKINLRSTPSKGLVNANIKSPTGTIQANRNPDGSYGLSFEDANPFNAGKSMLKLKEQLAGKTIYETKSFSTDSYTNILKLKKKLPFEETGFVPLNSSNKVNNFLDDLVTKNSKEWSASAKFKSEEAAIEGAKRMDDYMLKLGETTKSKVVNNNGKFEVHVPNYKIKVPEINNTSKELIESEKLQQKKYGGMMNYMAKKTWAMGGVNMEQEIDPKPATSSTKTFNNIVPLVDAKTGKPNWDNYYSTLNKMGTNVNSTNFEAKQTPAQSAINHYIGQGIVPQIKTYQGPLNIGLANKYGKAYNPTTGPTINQFLDSTEGAAALGSPEAYQDFLNNTKAYNDYRGKTQIPGTNTTGTSDPNAEMYGARYYNMFTPGYTAPAQPTISTPLTQKALGGQFAMGGMTMKQGIIHAPEMGGYFRKK